MFELLAHRIDIRILRDIGRLKLLRPEANFVQHFKSIKLIGESPVNAQSI